MNAANESARLAPGADIAQTTQATEYARLAFLATDAGCAPPLHELPPLSVYSEPVRKERHGRTERAAVPEASLIVECVANIEAKPIRWLWPQDYVHQNLNTAIVYCVAAHWLASNPK